MNNYNILILSASGGAGHLRAAEALHKTAEQLGLPLKTENYDCLDFTTKTFKRLYAGTYLNLVNYTPELWGYFYQKSEGKPYRKKGLISLFDHFNYQRYLRFLKSRNPDAIVCTHFLPFISVSNVIRKWGIETPIFAVTTDFDVHQYWVDPIIFKYYVYHEESLWQLQAKGIPARKISVAGIPVMPDFLLKPGKRVARKLLGLNERRTTILVLSGGFGVGHFEEIVATAVRTLSAFPGRQFNLIVVCGKNLPAKTSISKSMIPSNIAVSLHGFVSTIPEMMSAADLVITKSGGLTSAEALVKGLPMVIVDPIPGQEMRNADLIVEHGAGWKAIDLANLEYKLRRVLNNPQMLHDARIAAASLARPNAARDILTDVYRNIQPNREKIQ
ncbi:MAG TPA: glycosyltransferase [Bacteroidota bacterium]